MNDLRDPAERSAIAGEYVLGTLSREDHAAVADALQRDTLLLAEVYAWQDRLLALTLRSPAAAPSPGLWPRIESALAAKGPERSAAPERAPWWRGLRVWQGVSAGALALSIVLAVMLLGHAPLAPPDAPRYVAVLQSPDNRSTGWVVEMRTGGTLRLVPTANAGAVPEGRAWQFWTKPEGAAGPTSLGLVRAGQTIELPVSRLPAVATNQLFEITLEPEGGSTIGRPTGPILFVGRSVML